MHTLSVAITRQHDTVVLHPRGDVDHDSAPALTGVLEEIDQPWRGLAVDLSSVPFMDSAGLHALLTLERRCRDRGVPLTLTGVGEQPGRLLELVGLAGFFTVAR
ncbi:STAS domain-containing protein [Streptomyces chitinivorans]|uniref:Anti-sigma factor antagonist n=1 Tax=Streptomyces chitinivorans TaxID=1257027 RepID=A0ABW7HVQ5_9ACTN|nr:STAS domain-containing protein [Streptomyces chitinivorans]MDH2407846.1 STAS domain-containing protein [Streptomyces chitinivorans]